jgi:hypothetical protein
MVDLIELVSITAGSVILLGLIASIAVDGIRSKLSGRRERAILAVDARWNRVKVPLKSD